MLDLCGHAVRLFSEASSTSAALGEAQFQGIISYRQPPSAARISDFFNILPVTRRSDFGWQRP